MNMSYAKAMEENVKVAVSFVPSVILIFKEGLLSRSKTRKKGTKFRGCLHKKPRMWASIWDFSLPLILRLWMFLMQEEKKVYNDLARARDEISILAQQYEAAQKSYKVFSQDLLHWDWIGYGASACSTWRHSYNENGSLAKMDEKPN